MSAEETSAGDPTRINEQQQNASVGGVVTISIDVLRTTMREMIQEAMQDMNTQRNVWRQSGGNEGPEGIELFEEDPEYQAKLKQFQKWHPSTCRGTQDTKDADE
ncbi:hypothetical protein SLEP1_g2418 [Rubroshorea leprosula]|uniref:Uncharacterized protein n=1 Tax=Rubroshorea leprosula TaxID=152421 RepID=A0AAV5HH42_9ROSI|nr:hypothetical protein SLEP1_g2418 [Rubroshorea leprosula]